MVKKITLSGFLEAVGRQRFQDELGKSPQLVSRAKTDGFMPAHWFRDVRDWCVRNQIDVPEHLFRWDVKNPTKQNANSGKALQGLAKKNVTDASNAA